MAAGPKAILNEIADEHLKRALKELGFIRHGIDYAPGLNIDIARILFRVGEEST